MRGLRPGPAAGRDRMLLEALDLALDELEKRFGADMNRWEFGQEKLKHIWLPHPLSEAVRPSLRAQLEIPPQPRGGSAQTVNSTSDSEIQSSGASFRLIADTSDWDRSIGTNTPGQSGNPGSRHYRDLFIPWANGEYFPANYSRPKVEAATEQKSTLIPAINQ